MYKFHNSYFVVFEFFDFVYFVYFVKLVHSIRIAPHEACSLVLAEFDAAVRECCESESVTSLHPDDSAWDLATLASWPDSLGSGSIVAHASAAFLTSSSACKDLCRQLDFDFVWDLAAQHSDAHRTLNT